MSRFEELTPKAKAAYRSISKGTPSDARDQRINRIVQPASKPILRGKAGPAQKGGKK